jgi:tetratricopeptide (TPR) repeat protein
VKEVIIKVLKKIDVAVLMILFFLVYPCFGQSTAKQIWTKGVEYAAQGNFEKAKVEFEKVLEIDPSYESAKRFLKIINDVNEQRIKSKTVISYFKGLNFTEKKHWAEAIAEYKKVVDINPQFAEAYRSRGLVYAKKGQYDKAIADYTKAIELNPKDAWAYGNRAFAYIHKR